MFKKTLNKILLYATILFTAHTLNSCNSINENAKQSQTTNSITKEDMNTVINFIEASEAIVNEPFMSFTYNDSTYWCQLHREDSINFLELALYRKNNKIDIEYNLNKEGKIIKYSEFDHLNKCFLTNLFDSEAAQKEPDCKKLMKRITVAFDEKYK